MKKKKTFADWMAEIDKKIHEAQKAFYEIYDEFFSFNKALLVGIMVGAAFSFIGRDCYGMLSFDSPLVVLVFCLSVFVLIDIFKHVRLSFSKIVRLVFVVFAGFSLSFELYGVYSLDVKEYTQACKPYAYSNTWFGYAWIVIPILLLIFACFRGTENDKDDF